ncbi:hypothetical protein UCRPA7_4690 [Phaeoacremonium minimum UCRPA7]|uniref:Coiled-coil domain-containing protein 174 n=1 Tax=Phaeoacremonium minimum (strain UCR-PA7) TaxID=1286976 RepID=R8BKD8_PHAM7|nr:hypothetical protein UCRPA7_4690 [Phaeoacremonium minimum UCRPA7]EON99776.1 hypothetical protein UCRPA7_4690 [Phaeoacremonium minimum UCRPA7]
MPQDPNLYGQRPAKRQKKEMALSTSLDFKSQLTSLISKPSTSSSSSATGAISAGKPRPSKSKQDIFSGVKAKRSSKDPSSSSRRHQQSDNDNRLVLKDPRGTEEDKAEQARARRKMEAKARLYAAMQRGDYVPAEGEAAPLVDFDRKWAEKHPDGTGGGGVSSSDDGSDEEEEDNIDTEIIEYEDEFGRLRRGTRAEKARMERRLRARDVGAAELDRMSARPKAPDGLIYGDAVQAAAFVAADEDRMEELARRRDRSATPPEAKHYEADREIRTKGVGFYQFSKDEATREEEMRSLEAERQNTERERREREEKKEARKREIEARRAEIEARRKEIGEKRAKKMADSFLDGLAVDLSGDKDNGGAG